MLHAIVASTAQAILSVIADGGYLGIVFLMALESACIPIPSEIIMPFAGYLVGTGHFNLWLCATAGALGCNIGSVVAYEIGSAGTTSRFGTKCRTLLIRETELARAVALFQRFDSLAVFLCRLLPIVRTYIALPAGMVKMNRLRFHIYTFVGSWIWCFALAWAGLYLGNQWRTNPALHSAMHGLDGLVLITLLSGIGFWLFNRARRKQASPVVPRFTAKESETD